MGSVVWGQVCAGNHVRHSLGWERLDLKCFGLTSRREAQKAGTLHLGLSPPVAQQQHLLFLFKWQSKELAQSIPIPNGLHNSCYYTVALLPLRQVLQILLLSGKFHMQHYEPVSLIRRQLCCSLTLWWTNPSHYVLGSVLSVSRGLEESMREGLVWGSQSLAWVLRSAFSTWVTTQIQCSSAAIIARRHLPCSCLRSSIDLIKRGVRATI